MVVTEVTSETEFNKGWNSVDGSVSKEEVATDKTLTPSEQKPVETEEKTVMEGKKEEEKPSEKPEEKIEETEDKKVEQEPKPEEKPKPEKSAKIETETEATFEQRWKSQQGIVKSETKKREEAERRLSEREAEIARLKAEREKPAEKIDDKASDEISKLEDQYINAIIEDDRALAVKIRSQIDDLKLKQFKESIQKETDERVYSLISQKATLEKKNEVVKSAIKKYPFLDHTNEKKGNPYAILLVRAVAGEYENQGLDAAEALEAAVEEVALMFEKPKATKEVVEESTVDKEKVLPTVAVETKNTPVKTGGKPKGPQTFDEGWDSFR